MIVGAGPAGLTAALYTGRAKLKTKLLEKLSFGGQTLLTDVIENFPGVYQMNAYGWVDILKKQLAELRDVEMTEDITVEKIEPQDNAFRTSLIATVNGHKESLESRCVIVATGAVPKKLGIPGENAFVGKGVSYCATCDGPLFKEKNIVVIGGGDSALEEALYLRKFANKVIVVHRRNALRATAVLQDKAKADAKIAFQWESAPVEIIGKTKVEAIKIKNVNTGEVDLLPCEGVFVFIGFTPATQFLKGFIDLNATGYIVTDENMESSFPGVFACGDCRVRPFNQVVTACSDGAIAAYAAMKFLENKI